MKFKKIAALTVLSVGTVFFAGEAFAKTTALTPGIMLESNQSVISNKSQFVNRINVDLNNSYSTIDIGTSTPLTQRMTVTNQAKTHTREGHQVVGAVNASFFHVNTGEPAFLLAQNDRIAYLGTPAGADSSFGLTKDKKAQIKNADIDIAVTHNGKTISINNYNRSRPNDKSIIYTSSFRHSDTRTSSAGYEVVVTGLPKSVDQELAFGEKITGTVSAIRPYGQSGASKIPSSNGFVLSAHGAKMQDLKNMQIGDEVTLEMNINKEWQGAEFILASGPVLVEGGKAKTNIQHSSAAVRTARTAVTIDSTGKKVSMVTVDSKGNSKGMTLKEFAAYLSSLGVYQAINLDGGGSTALAARMPGNQYATLLNKPADGKERAVSATLHAISTAPTGPARKMTATQGRYNTFLAGAKNTYNVTSVLDDYNNVVNASNVTYSVTGGVGRMVQNQFIAEQAGSGAVVIQSGNVTVRFPITVEEQPARLAGDVKSVSLSKGKTQKVTITAYNATGKAMLYDAGQLKWSVQGDIGSIKQDGTFTAGKDGFGSLIAKLGNKQISIPVTVVSKPVVVSSLDDVKQWQATSAKSYTTLIQNNNANLKKGGTGYIGIKYDFTKIIQGTSASYMKPVSKLTVPNEPKSLSVWVWADAKKHWLRGSIKDKSGKVYYLDFTQQGKLDWKSEWRLQTAKLPAGIQYPITVESLYVAEPSANNKNAGLIYLDELMANY